VELAGVAIAKIAEEIGFDRGSGKESLIDLRVIES
jgi:hypothetical protein